MNVYGSASFNKKKLALSLVLFTVFPTWGAPGQWMPEARLIENIIVEGDAGGKALIVIQGGVPVDYISAGCNSPYNTLDLSTSKGKSQLAVALTAYSTGRPVKLALSCLDSRPLVTHIML